MKGFFGASRGGRDGPSQGEEEPGRTKGLRVAYGSDDALRFAHPQETRQEIAPAGAPAAAGGAAGGAGAGGVPIQEVTVHPAKQRFAVGGLTYFIIPRSSAPPTPSTRGHWLVKYYVDETTGLARPITSLNEKELIETDAISDATLDASGPEPKPDLKFSQEHLHFVMHDRKQQDIGELYLQPLLQAAERQDYEFAVRMQGLQNCSLNAVWTTEESGEGPKDRAELMEVFLQKYLMRFLAQAPMSQDDPDAIVQQAIQMHRQFCNGWGVEHQRGLSSTVEAAGEALIGMFYERRLRTLAPPDMTWKELGRVFRRDPRLGPQFGLCLHFYMVKMEQDRGGRNASYKSMYNAGASNLLSLNSMDRFLASEAGHIRGLLAEVREPDARRFHVNTVDWFGILTQLQRPTVRYTGAKRRSVGPPRAQAPWAMRAP